MAVAACTALTLSLGAMTAFAAGSGGSLVRVQNGNIAYSADDGKTWVNGKPEGFSSDGNTGRVIIDGTTVNPEGSISMENKGTNTHPAKDAASSLVRVEDGKISYSTDGGKTWISGAPEGFNIETDENGITHSWVGDRPADGDGAFTQRNGKGDLQHSYGLE